VGTDRESIVNILATINTGDFLCQNVRNSFQHAAKRWGCEYVEITQKFAEFDHPYSMKLELCKYPWPAGARLFFVEGDILIRDDCPSPFDAVPANVAFAAVLNDQGELDGIACNAQREAWDGISSAIHEVFDQAMTPYRGMYFNTGVFMVDPSKMAGPFAWASTVYEALKSYGADDQTVLSYAVQLCGAPVFVMDRRWNCVGPVAWQSSPTLPAWVTHYAKYRDFRDNTKRREMLERGRWRPLPPDGTSWQCRDCYPDKSCWHYFIRGGELYTYRLSDSAERKIENDPWAHIDAVRSGIWSMEIPPGLPEVPMLTDRNGVGELASIIT
jgi:hypothetical protein